VEFEMFETNTVGADIRNKLSPIKNLLCMLKHVKTEENPEIKTALQKIIDDEINKCEEIVEYLANLL